MRVIQDSLNASATVGDVVLVMFVSLLALVLALAALHKTLK